MKVLFVDKESFFPSLGIAWFSAYLRKAGHDVGLKVLKGRVDWRDVKADPPDMLCYLFATGEHDYYQQVNAGIRMTLETMGHTIVSVFAGSYVTKFPEYIRGQYMDIGVRGEGYEAIVDIANALRDKEPLIGIPNTVMAGQVNLSRPLLNKDTMLYPDRDLMYRCKRSRSNPIKNVLCSFDQAGHVEIRPVGEVMGEIEDVLRFPLDMLCFQDGIFPVCNEEWMDMFCTEYPKHCDKSFHIQTHPAFINDVIKAVRRLEQHDISVSVTFDAPGTKRYDRLQKLLAVASKSRLARALLPAVTHLSYRQLYKVA